MLPKKEEPLRASLWGLKGQFLYLGEHEQCREETPLPTRISAVPLLMTYETLIIGKADCENLQRLQHRNADIRSTANKITREVDSKTRKVTPISATWGRMNKKLKAKWSSKLVGRKRDQGTQEARSVLEAESHLDLCIVTDSHSGLRKNIQNSNPCLNICQLKKDHTVHMHSEECTF